MLVGIGPQAAADLGVEHFGEAFREAVGERLQEDVGIIVVGILEAAEMGLEPVDADREAADPIFGVGVPESCPDVPAEVLQPRNTWADKEAYDRQAHDLARRFNENFKKYEAGVSEAVRAVAPKV